MCWAVTRIAHFSDSIVMKRGAGSASCQETAGHVQCMEQGTEASALGQHRGMGGEGGGGLRMGDTCVAMADSCRRMAKTTTIL